MRRNFLFKTCAEEDCIEDSVLKSGHETCPTHMKCIKNDHYDPNSCDSCTKLIDSIMSGGEDYFSSVRKWKVHVSFISFKSTLILPLKWIDEELKEFFNILFLTKIKVAISLEVIFYCFLYSKLIYLYKYR